MYFSGGSIAYKRGVPFSGHMLVHMKNVSTLISVFVCMLKTASGHIYPYS